MSTTDMLIKIAPILLSIALGYVLTHTGILKAEMVDAFKKIVVNVTLPAGLLSAYIKIRFRAEYIFIILCLFMACFHNRKTDCQAFFGAVKIFPVSYDGV